MNPFASLTELRAGLDAGKFSSVELCQAYLDRISAHAELNCYITVTPEPALAQAAAADAKRAKGTAATTLLGLPIAHKDIFCTQGVLTTCGSHMLANFVAPYDATAVQRLQEAGCVTLGKTNLDEFAMGSSNENSFFGPVGNPWDTSYVPGGSSGGSAAAVAAGLCAVATGTDTGGSIRQPAAYCGISGLKPTYGRVSRYGMIAFAPNLDQGGVMARCVNDIALVLAHMSGFDNRDSTSLETANPWLEQLKLEKAAQLAEPATALTIGLPKEYYDGQVVGAEHLDNVRKELEAMGHTTVDISLPNTRAAVPAYYVIAGAEASTNLSRYDGVRFGHRAANPSSLEDLYCRSRSEGFGNEVKRRILTGTYALSVGYFDAYYLKAQKVRRLIQQDFLQAFAQVDAILAPTTPTAAFKLGALADPVSMYQQDIYTIPASLAGLPAMSIPCGFVDGLPIGAQLIGPHHGEETLLTLGHAYQQRSDWHTQHPPLTAQESAR
ncbi:MAG: Asp-tRNA(Asn)/Glu-tRNA(Gln) amidotransferase subunit GatA [Pseudomonadales bacterium]